MTLRWWAPMILSALSVAQQTLPSGYVFRSSTDAVSLQVAVRRSSRPVIGLTAPDFQVFDNGVPQSVTATAISALSIDVTLVVDSSGSVKGRLDDLKAQIRYVAEALDTTDRIRVLAFASEVRAVSDLQPARMPLPLDRLQPFGVTSFYHALAAALMAVPDGDRPQLIFAFSDGLDNASFLDASRLVSLAARTNAALFVALVRPTTTQPLTVTVYKGGPNRRLLREAAERAGGVLVEDVSDDMPAAFNRALQEFRTSYLLTYTPQGVKREGWHALSVKIARPGTFDIRTRPGYEGGH